MELSLSQKCEGSALAAGGVEDLLPEPCGEVQGREHVLPARPMSPMHSLTSFIEYLSIWLWLLRAWNQSQISVLLLDCQDRAVVPTVSWFEDSHL